MAQLYGVSEWPNQISEKYRRDGRRLGSFRLREHNPRQGRPSCESVRAPRMNFQHLRAAAVQRRSERRFLARLPTQCRPKDSKMGLRSGRQRAASKASDAGIVLTAKICNFRLPRSRTFKL